MKRSQCGACPYFNRLKRWGGSHQGGPVIYYEFYCSLHWCRCHEVRKCSKVKGVRK